MITGKSAILAYFEQVEKPYFAIFYKGQAEKGNAIIRNDKEEKDYDLASGKHRFENALELLGYGDYCIVIGGDKDVTKRGGNRVDFKIPVSEANANAAPQQPMAGIGGISIEEVESRASKMAEEKFKSLMNQQRLEDAEKKLAIVEKELKEAEKATTDPWHKFISAIAPHSDRIVSGLFGDRANVAALQVSGAQPDEVGETDNQQILENFVTAISNARPNDWQSIVVRFTDLINTNPAKFDTALNFL